MTEIKVKLSYLQIPLRYPRNTVAKLKKRIWNKLNYKFKMHILWLLIQQYMLIYKKWIQFFLFSAHNCGAKIKKIKQYAPIQTKVMMNQLQWLEVHTCIASYAMANLVSYTAVQKETMNQLQRLLSIFYTFHVLWLYCTV
jgi:hypothetical protein